MREIHQGHVQRRQLLLECDALPRYPLTTASQPMSRHHLRQSRSHAPAGIAMNTIALRRRLVVRSEEQAVVSSEKGCSNHAEESIHACL